MQDFRGLTISFSLFGEQQKYIKGMYANIDIIPDVYPGARIVVYTDKPYDFNGADIIVIGTSLGVQGAFWRYYAYSQDIEGWMICRDADSLVTTREAGLVREWMLSGKAAHTIHDHKEHVGCAVNLMAGMTGIKHGSLPYDFNHLITWWVKTKNPTQYRDEERFLNRFLWPYIRRYGLLHTSLVGSKYGGEKIDPPNEHETFIGSRAFT